MGDQDSNKEKSDFCSNCNFSLNNSAFYCPKCGQKNTDGRLTVKELFAQFFDNVFNLDSKIFRTLGSVFIPGKLTNAFLEGKRRRYYHPIRLFIVMIVISIAGLNYKGDITSPTNLTKEHIEILQERKRLMDVFDEGIETIAAQSDDSIVMETLDSLSNNFYKNSRTRYDSLNLNDAFKITDDFDFYVAIDDFEKYSPKEILEVYQVKGFYKRMVVKQKIKMILDGTGFIPFVMGKVTWVVFFVLLLLTLIFKLLYRKSDYLYLQHLIFGIHLNSFFFIIATILTLVPESNLQKLLPYGIIIMAIYLFIAMKRVYKQSYLITGLKFIIVSFCYFFSFIFGIIITAIGGFLVF